jgi:hypothetical protein
MLLGFDGPNAHLSLGGVVKGLVKRSKSFGLDPADVLQCATLGYRAGRLVLSNELPVPREQRNGNAEASM